MKLARLSVLAVLALLVASCNGNNNGGTGFAPLTGVNTNTVISPSDTEPVSSPVAYDVLLVQTSRPTIAAVNMTVTIMFNNQTVVLPASGSAPTLNTQLVAYLLFNTTGSGGLPFICDGIVAYPNVNFFVDPTARLADGNYQIKNAPAGAPTGEASTDIPKTLTTNGLSTIVFTIPLAALGGSSGATQLGIGVEHGPSTITDCAPDTGTIST